MIILYWNIQIMAKFFSKVYPVLSSNGIYILKSDIYGKKSNKG